MTPSGTSCHFKAVLADGRLAISGNAFSAVRRIVADVLSSSYPFIPVLFRSHQSGERVRTAPAYCKSGWSGAPEPRRARRMHPHQDVAQIPAAVRAAAPFFMGYRDLRNSSLKIRRFFCNSHDIRMTGKRIGQQAYLPHRRAFIFVRVQLLHQRRRHCSSCNDRGNNPPRLHARCPRPLINRPEGTGRACRRNFYSPCVSTRSGLSQIPHINRSNM